MRQQHSTTHLLENDLPRDDELLLLLVLRLVDDRLLDERLLEERLLEELRERLPMGSAAATRLVVSTRSKPIYGALFGLVVCRPSVYVRVTVMKHTATAMYMRAFAYLPVRKE